jgi:hypothetical protein
MIILDLCCDKNHRFEGWFASSDAFRDQCTRNGVRCPHCDSLAISQLPSAPHVRRLGAGVVEVKGGDIPPVPAAVPALADNLASEAFSEAVQRAIKTFAVMARGAENVGDRFPEEARRIHYEEAPSRTIRGVASTEEALELIEEGILVMPMLSPPESETH